MLAGRPIQVVLHIPGFIVVLEGGCMFINGRLGFVLLTDVNANHNLAQYLSPAMRVRELSVAGRCYRVREDLRFS